jgi:hypothetical protein
VWWPENQPGKIGAPAQRRIWMKKSMIVAAAAMLSVVGFAAGPANAAGCVKGAMVGGVAGHVAGHHGLLGAGVGCLIGRHEANRRDRTDENWNRDRTDRYRGDGYGSSREPNYRYQTGSEYSR